jgi:WD40 repeat protein
LAGWSVVLLGDHCLEALRPPEASGPRFVGMRALVTSPGESGPGRLSPDGRRLAFVSDQDGQRRVWLAEVDPTAEGLGEPMPVELPSGAVSGVVWAPDGGRLAAALHQDGTSFLAILSAGRRAGTPGTDPPWLPLPMQQPRLVRWLRGGIYIESQGGLWRFEPGSRSLEPLGRPQGLDAVHAIDVRPDEQAIVFVGSLGAQLDLWSARLDGSLPERLTRDAGSKSAPLWAGSDRRSLVYASDRAGPLNLWRLDLASHTSRPLTFGVASELPEDASLDGRRILFRRTEAEVRVCRLDPCTGRETELTFGPEPLRPAPGLFGTAGAEEAPLMAAFDPASRTLYRTRLERASHNLYAYPAGRRDGRRLTDHRFPGITIAGLELEPDGRLIYARRWRTTTLWSIEPLP